MASGLAGPLWCSGGTEGRARGASALKRSVTASAAVSEKPVGRAEKAGGLPARSQVARGLEDGAWGERAGRGRGRGAQLPPPRGRVRARGEGALASRPTISVAVSAPVAWRPPPRLRRLRPRAALSLRAVRSAHALRGRRAPHRAGAGGAPECRSALRLAPSRAILTFSPEARTFRILWGVPEWLASPLLCFGAVRKQNQGHVNTSSAIRGVKRQPSRPRSGARAGACVAWAAAQRGGQTARAGPSPPRCQNGARFKLISCLFLEFSMYFWAAAGGGWLKLRKKQPRMRGAAALGFSSSPGGGGSGHGR